MVIWDGPKSSAWNSSSATWNGKTIPVSGRIAAREDDRTYRGKFSSFQPVGAIAIGNVADGVHISPLTKDPAGAEKERTNMMDMNMGMGMMLGMGLFGLLVVIVLVLAIVALVKYLMSGPK